MAITYSTDIQTARFNIVLTAIAGGVLHIGTAGRATSLVSFQLANPAGILSGGQIVLDTPLEAVATGTGVAAEAWIVGGDSSIAAYGMTVGTVTADVVLTATTIDAADTVLINTAVIRNG